MKAINDCIALRDNLKIKASINEKNDALDWKGTSEADFNEKAKQVSTLFFDKDEDIRALKQYTLFGVKGIAAYAEHGCGLTNY